MTLRSRALTFVLPLPTPCPQLTAEMAATQQKPPAWWLAIKPYVNGGLSGMAATCIIQPIDMVKVRIQLGAKGSAVSTVAGRAVAGQAQQLGSCSTWAEFADLCGHRM